MVPVKRSEDRNDGNGGPQVDRDGEIAGVGPQNRTTDMDALVIPPTPKRECGNQVFPVQQLGLGTMIGQISYPDVILDFHGKTRLSPEMNDPFCC